MIAEQLTLFENPIVTIMQQPTDLPPFVTQVFDEFITEDAFLCLSRNPFRASADSEDNKENEGFNIGLSIKGEKQFLKFFPFNWINNIQSQGRFLRGVTSLGTLDAGEILNALINDFNLAFTSYTPFTKILGLNEKPLYLPGQVSIMDPIVQELLERTNKNSNDIHYNKMRGK